MLPPSSLPSPRSAGPSWRSRALDATARTLDHADDLSVLWKRLLDDSVCVDDDLDARVALDVLSTLQREMHDLRRRLDGSAEPPTG